MLADHGVPATLGECKTLYKDDESLKAKTFLRKEDDDKRRAEVVGSTEAYYSMEIESWRWGKSRRKKNPFTVFNHCTALPQDPLIAEYLCISAFPRS